MVYCWYLNINDEKVRKSVWWSMFYVRLWIGMNRLEDAKHQTPLIDTHTKG